MIDTGKTAKYYGYENTRLCSNALKYLNSNTLLIPKNFGGHCFAIYVRTVFPDSHRLCQDNDAKHVSKSTQAFMAKNDINWWQSPPESPDLNAIENVWNEMKVFCLKRRPHNKEDLLDGIREFWSNLTPERCNRYINHLYKVVSVVGREGDVSGF